MRLSGGGRGGRGGSRRRRDVCEGDGPHVTLFHVDDSRFLCLMMPGGTATPPPPPSAVPFLRVSASIPYSSNIPPLASIPLPSPPPPRIFIFVVPLTFTSTIPTIIFFQISPPNQQPSQPLRRSLLRMTTQSNQQNGLLGCDADGCEAEHQSRVPEPLGDRVGLLHEGPLEGRGPG